jgi:transcriptional regulator with XRE-family HTH domain
MTPEQCRAARGLLGVSQGEVAQKANVGRRTLADFENAVRKPYSRTLRDIKSVLEDKGVIFINEDDKGGVGVRLKKE